MSSTQKPVVRYLSDAANYGDLWRVIASVHRLAPFLVEKEDLFQDTALRALGTRKGFVGDSYGQFLGWFRAIARRLLIDCIRRSRRRPNMFPFAEDVPAQVDEGSDLAEIRNFLETVFSPLTPMEAALLRARHLADLSYEQIARLINKKPLAVRQTHSRLLKRLKHRYSKTPR